MNNRFDDIKMIYDATIIANGASKDAYRSGIYFVAANLLKRFINMNIDIALYCNYKRIKDLETVLKTDFPDSKFEIITEVGNKKFLGYYLAIREQRTRLRDENKYIKKFFLQFYLFLMKIVIELNKFFSIHSEKYKQFNVYFSPGDSVSNIIKDKIYIKKYTLLHDIIPLLFPEYFKSYNSGSSFYRLIKSLNKSDYYFANSELTKRDFLVHCSEINPDHIKTTLLACDEKFKPESLNQITQAKQKYNIPINCRYVFSLCTLEPRKNLVRAVKTFIKFIKKNNISDMYFVLGGGHWKEFIGKLEQEIENLGEYKDKIIKAGYIDDEDLPSLYSGAEWFVYTSQYEGFGLPPLEAMSCGCPVITSNNSSLPEVVGDAGIMIDWDSDEQHIDAYEQYYFNNELRSTNRQKGLDRAKQFSWDKCVNEMLTVMREADKL